VRENDPGLAENCQASATTPSRPGPLAREEPAREARVAGDDGRVTSPVFRTSPDDVVVGRKIAHGWWGGVLLLLPAFTDAVS